MRGDFVRELVEDAQTRVRARYTVAAPLAGQLLRPTLQAGDAVQAGQVVAEIQPSAPVLLDTRSQGEQRHRKRTRDNHLHGPRLTCRPRPNSRDFAAAGAQAKRFCRDQRPSQNRLN